MPRLISESRYFADWLPNFTIFSSDRLTKLKGFFLANQSSKCYFFFLWLISQLLVTDRRNSWVIPAYDWKFSQFFPFAIFPRNWLSNFVIFSHNWLTNFVNFSMVKWQISQFLMTVTKFTIFPHVRLKIFTIFSHDWLTNVTIFSHDWFHIFSYDWRKKISRRTVRATRRRTLLNWSRFSTKQK